MKKRLLVTVLMLELLALAVFLFPAEDVEISADDVTSVSSRIKQDNETPVPVTYSL